MVRRRIRHAGRRGKNRLMGEINMTPILDMTFLLLIAFIITFPALQGGIEVKLPSAKGEPLKEQPKPVAVNINAQGRVFLGTEEVTDEALAERLAAIAQEAPETVVQIRGDETQSYGRIMDVIKVVRKARLSKFTLVTEQE